MEEPTHSSSAEEQTEGSTIDAALLRAVKARSVEELTAVLARAARERFAGKEVTAASKLLRALLVMPLVIWAPLNPYF